MPVHESHETQSELQALNAESPLSAETDIQGYLLPWSGPIFAAEPPPGTTDPYGPPMPGRDIPAHPFYGKPIRE